VYNSISSVDSIVVGLAEGLSLQEGVDFSCIRGSLFVNCRIVKCSNKVLAPRIVYRYALSKGSIKGL
jgi:hypothetical protein